MDWAKQSVLITGGTGSFGKMFTRVLLEKYHPRKIIIFSRDELKQHDMATGGGFDHPSMRFFIGDVRDRERLERAMRDVDIVVHAAAMKQVPTCEYNPIEAVQTNINGSRNVIDAALNTRVKKVIALSTDKAVNPVNLYGATKLVAEKLFIQSNAYTGNTDGARFACVRYGNVLGSRGSVIPLFLKQRQTGVVTVTHEDMTRFWISLRNAADFVATCIEEMVGGEVFIPKIPTMKLMDLARAIAPEAEIRFVGIRPGEKLHEALIGEDESQHVIENHMKYILLPAHPWWKMGDYGETQKVEFGFKYMSNNGDWQLSVDDLRGFVSEMLATAQIEQRYTNGVHPVRPAVDQPV